jgi:hypothetical protein
VDRPEPLLIYVPGVRRDEKGSVLMELGGGCYEPQLKRLARDVLRERYIDGVIDEMLAPERLTSADVVALLKQGSGGEQAGEAGQVAKDNGAKRALIPIENKRAFLDGPADIIERVDPVFLGGSKTAAFKALGLN